MTRTSLALLEMTVKETGHILPEEVELLFTALRCAWNELDQLRADNARLRGEPVQTLAQVLHEIATGYRHVGPLPDPDSIPF